MREKAVGIILLSPDGKVAIGKKRGDSSSVLAGKWHLPSEKIKAGENIYHAAQRGMVEELGLVLNSFMCLTTGEEVVWCLCGVADDKPIVPGSDLEAAKWVKRIEVAKSIDPLAWEMLPEKIKKYFE
jgi:hypothetical protein